MLSPLAVERLLTTGVRRAAASDNQDICVNVLPYYSRLRPGSTFLLLNNLQAGFWLQQPGDCCQLASLPHMVCTDKLNC